MASRCHRHLHACRIDKGRMTKGEEKGKQNAVELRASAKKWEESYVDYRQNSTAKTRFVRGRSLGIFHLSSSR